MSRTPPSTTTSHGAPAAVVHRLIDALNRGDLEGMLDCFDPGVRIEVPTQPERGVQGREHLRAYWEAALDGVGEIHAKLLRCATDGDTVLTEWCWNGTRADGTSFARAGVTVQGVVGERIAWQRTYMAPVRGDPETVGAWIVKEMASRRKA
jgi:limonene-1,2-epoxide hydrolase